MINNIKKNLISKGYSFPIKILENPYEKVEENIKYQSPAPISNNKYKTLYYSMKLNYLDKFQKTIKDIKEISEEVYKELGPGFDESDYQMAMSLEFSKSKDFEAIRENDYQINPKSMPLLKTPLSFDFFHTHLY